MSNQNVSISRSPAVEAFLNKMNKSRGRLSFIIDATASRQAGWDTAAQLQAEMFQTAAAIGGLEIQLIYFRGYSECSASRWVTDGQALAGMMAKILCQSGHTKFQKALAHVRREHAKAKIDAVIAIGDACEEIPADLYGEARELGGVPLFAFQEGSDDRVAGIFAELAHITGGAYCKFDANASQKLADLLKAVAAFATGGLAALEGQKTDAATLLLTQLKGGRS
jgi:hypothetical protein